jgi:hypothetical protein
MKCPQCKDQTLVMADRQGVEIDYCPACRGIWLDRGELDKLLERAASVSPASSQPAPRAQHYPKHDDDDRHHGYKHRHSKSWLSEIFD